MRVTDYFSLLARHRFAIHPTRLPMAFLISGCTAINSTAALAQKMFYGRRIRETTLDQPPIFIVGHWRTGTTLLHELLGHDSRFAFPNNVECFAPHHFLVTGKLVSPIVRLLMPSRRPMDNMEIKSNFPQEDEFALCSLGAPTPYFRVAFPNHEPEYMELLNFDNADPELIERFRSGLDYFFKALTVKYQRPLILKSPPHTGRIKLLSKWYPGAKFIHICRDPLKIFTSTKRLWRTLDQVQGFQLPKYSDEKLNELVFQSLNSMYDGYLRQRSDIDVKNLVEVRFEDVVADPVAEIGRIYETLEIDRFDDLKPSLLEYQRSRKDYRGNPSVIDEATAADVKANWRQYYDAFGY